MVRTGGNEAVWLFSVPAGSFFIAMRTEEAGKSRFSVLRGNYTVCVMLMDLAMIPKSGGIRQVPI